MGKNASKQKPETYTITDLRFLQQRKRGAVASIWHILKQ